MSFMGAAEWEKLRNDGVTLSQSTIRSVRVANGENCPVIGSVIVPVLVGDVKKMVNFLVVPALPHELILGMDFWRAFGLVVDAPKERAGVGAGVLDEVVVSRDGLSEQQRVALERLVERFRASLGRPGLGCTHLVTHRIDTGDATPVRQRCYSYSPRLIEVLHTGLEDWLKKGVVEPSSSPWASPVLLIKKGDGSYFILYAEENNRSTKRVRLLSEEPVWIPAPELGEGAATGWGTAYGRSTGTGYGLSTGTGCGAGTGTAYGRSTGTGTGCGTGTATSRVTGTGTGCATGTPSCRLTVTCSRMRPLRGHLHVSQHTVNVKIKITSAELFSSTLVSAELSSSALVSAELSSSALIGCHHGNWRPRDRAVCLLSSFLPSPGPPAASSGRALELEKKAIRRDLG
ncbi:Pro-Pol polyprotein [Frankliniella fusca]|uniref:Pro-Pol polyprotein n=1 Tax=Frankliniella fusca TaxID=407009 RepID=A0AAE1H2U4_9NEOP|nr:Pro-Pol polyprotein [Frankliniella fusca]